MRVRQCTLLAATALACGGSTGPTGNPVPILLAVSPSELRAGTASATLKVTGRNFLPSSQVLWHSNPRNSAYVSSTELTVDLTALDLSVPGTAYITVFNSPPAGGTSAPVLVVIRR